MISVMHASADLFSGYDYLNSPTSDYSGYGPYGTYNKPRTPNSGYGPSDGYRGPSDSGYGPSYDSYGRGTPRSPSQYDDPGMDYDFCPSALRVRQLSLYKELHLTLSHLTYARLQQIFEGITCRPIRLLFLALYLWYCC